MSLKHGSLFLICSFSSPVSVIHSLYSLAMGMRIARLPSENRREHFILKKKKTGQENFHYTIVFP